MKPVTLHFEIGKEGLSLTVHNRLAFALLPVTLALWLLELLIERIRHAW